MLYPSFFNKDVFKQFENYYVRFYFFDVYTISEFSTIGYLNKDEDIRYPRTGHDPVDGAVRLVLNCYETFSDLWFDLDMILDKWSSKL